MRRDASQFWNDTRLQARRKEERLMCLRNRASEDAYRLPHGTGDCETTVYIGQYERSRP
jgi:hypothetical protein